MSLNNRVRKIEEKLEKKEGTEDFEMEINFVEYDPERSEDGPYSYISYRNKEERN